MNKTIIIAGVLLIAVAVVARVAIKNAQSVPDTGSAAPTAAVAPSGAANQPAVAVMGIAWNGDFSTASSIAKSSKKPMLIDFYTDWCHWCKKLDEDVYTDAQVKQLSQKFVCVKVNAEQRTDLAQQYSVNGYPTIIFLNSDGGEVKRVGGYEPPAEFLRSMNEALSASGVQ